MNRGILILLYFFCTQNVNSQVLGDYILNYSSYLGGLDYDLGRDLAIDREANIYVTGGTSSPDFPTTAGAHNIIYNNQGSPTIGNWGPMMVFVSKFSPKGELIQRVYTWIH